MMNTTYSSTRNQLNTTITRLKPPDSSSVAPFTSSRQSWRVMREAISRKSISLRRKSCTLSGMNGIAAACDA